MRRFPKVLAAALTAATMVSSMIMPAFAANYTPVAGTSTSFDKYLVIDADATIPEIEFEFTIEAGTAIPASAGKMEVIPGPMVAETEATEAVEAVYRAATPEEEEADEGVDELLVSDGTQKDALGQPIASGTKIVLVSEAAPAQEASEGGPIIGTAAFAEGDSASTTVASGDAVVLDDGEAYAKKVVTVDFANVTFDEPGIYRYKITEQEIAGRTDIEYDTQKGAGATAKVRYLDVYVIDNAGSLAVSAYVLHEQASDVTTTDQMGSLNSEVTEWTVDGQAYDSREAAETAAKRLVTAGAAGTVDEGKFIYDGTAYDTQADAEAAAVADIAPSAVELGDKSQGFVNEFDSQNLTFGKEVEGNQGSKDKYFDFTLAITGAQPNMTYAVDLSQAEASSGANSATIAANANKTNPATITVDENGAATVHYYLKDGQYVTVKGLPKDSTYAITENNEDYLSQNGTSKVAVAGVAAVAESWVVDSQTFTSEQDAKGYVDRQDGNLTYDDIVHNEGTPGVEEKLHQDAQTGTISTEDIYTGFTNIRDGIIPTGVMMRYAPYALFAVLGFAGIVFFATRKKED